MTTLYFDRSTAVQSLALYDGERKLRSTVLGQLDGRSGEWVPETLSFLAGDRPGRLVVGIGPGSFAGIRAALAFAQGWALGAPGTEVLGLPSAAALATGGKHRAIVGDARCGKLWIALYDGYLAEREIFQVEADRLAAAVPAECEVLTSEAARLDERLAAVFGERYLGNAAPLAENLAAAALANPQLLVAEPLPIYLNPAVRKN